MKCTNFIKSMNLIPYSTIYHFFWTDFCDWYIEVSKPRMTDSEEKETCLAVQDICIAKSFYSFIRLHRLLPKSFGFIGLRQRSKHSGFLTRQRGRISKTLKWPQGFDLNRTAWNEVSRTRDLVTLLRALKPSVI